MTNRPYTYTCPNCKKERVIRLEVQQEAFVKCECKEVMIRSEFAIPTT